MERYKPFFEDIDIDKIKSIIKDLSVSQIVNYDWDKIAFGFSQDDIISIPLKNIKIKYKGDMDNVTGFSMKDYFKNKPFSKLPPIEVSYNKGKFYIEDGHHRYGYAKELKLKNIDVKIEDIKDNPILALGFKSIDDIIKLKKQMNEDIVIPLEKGMPFKYGKFKNKQAIYDHSYVNEKGDLILVTDTGKEISGTKFRLIQESKFSENLRFTDLMKKASMSDFTKGFAKETNKLMGAPTTHTKLKSMKVNKKQDYIIFVWKTKRTPKYDKGTPMKVVDPKADFSLKSARVYTIEIKILDFFKLLHTKPNGDFTNKDIEDVFNVCDIQIWSNVPAFHWMGMNYNMGMFDASLYPTDIEPKHWNDYHNSDQFLDKHTAGVVNSIKFYIPQMRQMIKKYMGLTKK